MFKQFDEGKNILKKKLTKTNIVDFYINHSSPLIYKYNEKANSVVFGKNIPGLILFREETDEKTKALDDIMRTVSERVKPKIQVVVSDIKNDLEVKFAEYIGVKKEELPAIFIADTRKDFKKYKYTGSIVVDSFTSDLTAENIIRNFLNTLNQHLFQKNKKDQFIT